MEFIKKTGDGGVLMIGMQEIKGVAMDIVKRAPVKESSGRKLKEKPSLKTEEINFPKGAGDDKLSREELGEMLKVAQRVIFGSDTHYEFRLHEKTGTMMCKLVDNETDEIVKEIPSEKILDMVAGIWELVGIIVDEKA